MTTYYSQVELSRLIESANSVCKRDSAKPELTILRNQYVA